jgi:hypothetical protein
VELPQPRKLTVPAGKSVVVAPIGDIQWAGRRDQIAFQHLKDHLAHALDRDAWFVGTGDYIDFASPSNRQRIKAAALYDTAEQVIDDKAQALVDELYDELLAPTTGRWLGLVEGHHFTHLLTGETSDQYLCKKLKAPFLGTCAMLGLAFPTHQSSRMVTLWVHHGAGGGQKVHAPLLKLENLSAYWEMVDVFIVGHMTKQPAAPIPKVRVEWGSKGYPALRERRVYLVGAGGWFKGYAERSRHGNIPRGNYVEQKMLSPVSLGAPLIRITPKMRSEAQGRKQIHATSPSTGRRQTKELARAERTISYWEPEIRVEV